ncbi:hypothetical protein CCP4SC76_5600017 [Gammaproteobacteria bacterium]
MNSPENHQTCWALFFKQIPKLGKGIVSGGGYGFGRPFWGAGFEQALMLVVVAIDAEQFPVAAVGRVVVVVVVTMVNRQFPQILAGELAATTPAHPGVEFEGLLPVALFPHQPCLLCVGYDLIESVVIHCDSR